MKKIASMIDEFLTWMSFFFHGSRFQVQYSAGRVVATVFLRRQLIFHLLQIVRMNKLEQAAMNPIVLEKNKPKINSMIMEV